jgi:hypothetical protein
MLHGVANQQQLARYSTQTIMSRRSIHSTTEALKLLLAIISVLNNHTGSAA